MKFAAVSALALAFLFPIRAQSLADIAAGKAQIIDLTYPLNAANAFWPGGDYHPFQYRKIASLENDGVFSGEFSTPEHLGTHLDAPNHFESNRKSVDQIPLQDLTAPFVVIDLTAESRRDPDTMLTTSQVESWEKVHGRIPPGSVVLLRTGWGQYWSDSKRYQGLDSSGALHFPGYSPEAARFLVGERDIKGIGIDNLSVDRGLSKGFEAHHIVNAAQKYHLENLANLERLPARGGFLLIAPIKIEGGSGGQARVWAILPATQ